MGTIIPLRPATHLHPLAPAGSAGDTMQLPPGVLAAHIRQLELLGRASTTIYARKRALARLSTSLPVPVLDATSADLAGWRDAMNLAPASIASYVAHVSGFYRWAAETGLITASPAGALPVPRLPRRLPRPIAEADLMAAVLGAPPRIRPWLVLAGWAGLRSVEIALLRVECIRFDASPPYLHVVDGATKGHLEHIVPMCAFVVAELRACGLPASGYAFRRHDGQRGPNAAWRVSYLANQYLHSIGISSTVHAGRHRFGSEAYRHDHDLRAVQSMMGHASPATTALYVAVSQPSAVAAVEHLPVPRKLRAVRNTQPS